MRCASPVCDRRDLTPHHLVFRSQGGGDEDANVEALCVACHLEGVHAGRIAVKGPVAQIRWEIGRPAVVEVCGRHRRQLG